MNRLTERTNDVVISAERYDKHSLQQIVKAERTKHSRKPNEVRQRIDKLFGDIPRLELFAREYPLWWNGWETK